MISPTDPEAVEVVRGIVVPTVWDRAGNPLRVSILTADEGEYPVSPRGLGRRLFAFLTEEVRARVVVETDPSGNTMTRVVSFTVVKQNGNDFEPVVDVPPSRSACTAEPGDMKRRG
jgi:hypothetical protein